MLHGFVQTVDEESHFVNCVYVILSGVLEFEGAIRAIVSVIDCVDAIIKFGQLFRVVSLPGAFEDCRFSILLAWRDNDV